MRTTLRESGRVSTPKVAAHDAPPRDAGPSTSTPSTSTNASLNQSLPVPQRAAPGGPSDGAPANLGPVFLGCTFVLAFCSITYELLLGQTLSAFLGNTVLRYCVTIGLYMLSMGIGAMLANRRALRRPVRSLQQVEILLTVLGGASVMSLFLADGAGTPGWALALGAHVLVIVIGVLTGLEIPLLIEARAHAGSARSDGAQGGTAQGDSGHAGEVLGIDYAGAFAGTVLFALWFYPRLGIVPTAFGVASLNALMGLVLGLIGDRGPDGTRLRSVPLIAAQGALLALLLVLLTFSTPIAEAGLAQYLRN